MRLANRVLEHHPVIREAPRGGQARRERHLVLGSGHGDAAARLREEYGCGGAVISAVPLCHGIGVLRGLEMVEVEGATGEIDTNFEGKLEATWASLQKYDFVCLHLEAPDECTHNGDLKGKVQAIEWLDSRLVKPLTERLDAAHMDYRLLLLSDHKTLTATRGHDGDPVPYLLYDSRIDSGRGGVYTEKAGENGPFVAHGCELLHLLFER